MAEKEFWQGKNVLITGHTGFKGSWLCLWLSQLGANVTGYALKPPTTPSLYEIAKVESLVHTVEGDVRDLEKLKKTLQAARPEIVIHMAAQPLVRDSYKIPVETYETNVMGTVHLLEAVRRTEGVKAVINVTTDKCYENKEWLWGYRENEPMGGYDPYSSSKGCSELVTSAYRNSFFPPERYKQHGVAAASARAGNVIGGGDWAADRLIPDCIAALTKKRPVTIRSPHAIRPWQHVLEPLSGYMNLARHLYREGAAYAEGWNFGPLESDAKSVGWIVETMCRMWGKDAAYVIDAGEQVHEANYLKLDCAKAKARLGWQPRWTLEESLGKIIEWTHAWQNGENMQNICFDQINAYINTEKER